MTGISYGERLTGMSRADLDATLDDAQDLGTTWIRVQLSWDTVQPASPKKFDWTEFDPVVAAAAHHGLKLLVLLTFTPQWARGKSCRQRECGPAVPAQFGAFAKAAAARYAPRGVHTWEIWNEPNKRGSWKPKPDASRYVKVLSAASKGIRSVDSKSRIVSGGLAPSASRDDDLSQLDFLEKFCALGGTHLVDAVGYHPYSYPVLPSTVVAWNAWSQISQTSRSVVSILSAHGAKNLPIWLTEYGAPTDGPGARATRSEPMIGDSPDHVSEEYQAEMATDAVRSAATSPQIDALFWYTDRDLGTDENDVEDHFGLRRIDGSEKPAYSALRVAIRQLPRTPQTRR